MKIWRYKLNEKWNWYEFLIPTLLNPITWKNDNKKAYRWLFWGLVYNVNKK